MNSGTLAISVAMVMASAAVASAAESIGKAAIIENTVTGTLDGAASAAPLQRGDNLFANQKIETASDGKAQLLFSDQSALSISPNSTVILDKFVYDPAPNVGTVVLNTVAGAFRFVGGTADKTAGSSYEVKTPVGTIGIRGTLFDWQITGDQLSAVLHEGAIDVCLTGQGCASMTQPGTYVLTRGTKLSGIQRWDGPSGEARTVAPPPTTTDTLKQQQIQQPPSAEASRRRNPNGI